jgi:hypothetical protein
MKYPAERNGLVRVIGIASQDSHVEFKGRQDILFVVVLIVRCYSSKGSIWNVDVMPLWVIKFIVASDIVGPFRTQHEEPLSLIFLGQSLKDGSPAGIKFRVLLKNRYDPRESLGTPFFKFCVGNGPTNHVATSVECLETSGI